MSEYVKAFALSALKAGQIRCVPVLDKRILLANVENTVHAVDDMCTHEDASLALGCLQGDYIKCPLHGSRFNLCTGEPVDEPATITLPVYPVKVIDGFIYVKLEQENK